MTSTLGLVIISILTLIMFGLSIMISVWYKKPTPGKAIIRTGNGGMLITFDRGIFIIPTLHKMTEIDISSKECDFDFSGNNALIAKNGERIEMTGQFVVRINLDYRDLRQAVMKLGVERINNKEQFNSYFRHKFTDGILMVSRSLNGEDMVNKSGEFKVKILNYIGTDLNGVVLDDLVITKLSKMTF